MTKICFPLEGLNNSGGVRIITDLANNLAENGFIVDVIVPDYRSNCYYPFSENINLRIVKTNSLFNKKLFYLYYLFRYSSKNVYYYSFATGYKTPLFIFISKLLNFSSTKLVYIIQHYEISSQIKFNNSENYFIKILKIGIAKFGFYVPSIKIAVSHWIKIQINDSNINVIPNGIDLNIFKIKILSEHRELYSIGIVGSTKPIKGYNLIIKAISNLKSDLRIKIKLYILSTDKIQLPSNISSKHIIPETSQDISNFYNECNLFIFGSYEEGFGLPPLEAMASGCVILSSDCGGVRTFLDETNSFLFKPGDYIDLSKKIEFILNNPSKINDIREAGVLKSKEFSLDLMLNSYVSILKK